MSHTKGPWVYSEGRIKMILDPSKTEFAEFKLQAGVPQPLWEMSTAAYEVFVQFPPSGWKEMQEANGRLMAAAPEMLADLEIALGTMQDSPGAHNEKIEIVQAAIKKAKGGI